MAGKNEAKRSKTAKKNARRRAKKSSGMLASAGARVLLRGSVPRPYMNVQGTDDGLVVRGLEVVQTLQTSQLAKTLAIGLNPARAQVFPRLSGLALQFERYRFNRLRAHYFTACPATRSGSLGIAVHTEYTPNGKVPTTGPQFATYEYSRVGTVADSMSAPEWRVKDPEFFYIGSGTLAQDDVLKVFQGSLVAWVDNSVAADSGLLAGYLALEYDVSFRSWRPTQQRCLSTTRDGFTATVTGGGPQIIPAAPFDEKGVAGQSVGYFDQVEGLEDVVDPTTASTFNSTDRTKKILDGLASGAAWAFDYYMGVGAATVLESLPLRRGKGLSQMKPIPLKVVEPPSPEDAKCEDAVKLGDGVTISGYYNPEFIKHPPFGYLPYPEDVPRDGNVVQTLRSKGYLPDAAGDLAVTLYTYNPSAQALGIVITDHYSFGTGASAIEESHQVDLPDGYTSAWWGVVPTGTEVRTISDVVQNFLIKELP